MNSVGTPLIGGLDQAEIKFLVNQSADGVVVLAEDGIVLFVNPAAEDIFGRSNDELVGAPLGIPIVAGETTEITVLRPSGHQVDTEIRTVETNWNGRPVRLASLRDISARKAAEENLRHSAKMEAVGQLTAGIAHDFNNLLTVVLGNLETARRRCEITDPELLKMLENATRGAKRAASLTERLLAFARRKPLEPQPVDANALVSGMFDLLHRTLGDGIVVRTQLDPHIWTLEADPSELEAAILNLAVNSRDAMPDGGELVIETANVEVDKGYGSHLEDFAPGAYVIVSVTDTGNGMPQDVLKRVFEPFFTTKPDGRGTGLGLSQVYGFAKQSGGHARVYSEPGLGTTVRLYLPKAASGANSVVRSRSATETASEAIPLGSPGETILLVEDNDDVRSYAANALRELGYSVYEASHAHSAMKILANDARIDLLLTDLGLPGGMDGRTLAQRARLMRPSLKVLIMTAYAGQSLVHQGRLDAGVDLLSKPFTHAHLALRIRQLLNVHPSQRSGTILIVEDEFFIREFFSDALGDEGYEIDQAADYREAVAKLNALGSRLACAIVDVGLPDRNGDALIDHIQSVAPGAPVILASGYVDRQLETRFANTPGVSIMTKPCDLRTLVDNLNRLGVARPASVKNDA